MEGDRSGWLLDDPALRDAVIPVHVMTNAGHTMMLDDAAGFARAVTAALSDDRRSVVSV